VEAEVFLKLSSESLRASNLVRGSDSLWDAAGAECTRAWLILKPSINGTGIAMCLGSSATVVNSSSAANVEMLVSIRDAKAYEQSALLGQRVPEAATRLGLSVG
jgi:hypothetical protein